VRVGASGTADVTGPGTGNRIVPLQHGCRDPGNDTQNGTESIDCILVAHLSPRRTGFTGSQRFPTDLSRPV
jgi:hypothetical protein